MTRLDKAALGVSGVMTLLFAPRALDAARLYKELDQISGAMCMVGILGWIIATYGPIMVFVSSWHLSLRLRATWVVHLLVTPCAGITLLAGSKIMLYLIRDPDFDATLGAPVMPAPLLFVIAFVGYFSVLIFKQIKSAPRRA
ncbi:hypothetical protein [Flavisphingomonas formosensis]|uniref:hypothetical protein n=1 Tax=Flavisphingomonas formosensis TaxID=861534 RepID=UPI0012FB3D0C|nr:hypothetical protein [Sphingomonas formosensis]